ncbi:MAG: ZPR1 zinc finger domain-containing protein [Desulfurococcaceae archaeon]
MGLVKILEYEMKCPVCGNVFKLSDYLYEAPLFGQIIISSGVCLNCGYKWSEERLASSNKPIRITYRVDKIDDLNAIVIRSPVAVVKVPELGLELKPSYYSQGYITTVEGLIQDFYDKLLFLCSNASDGNECFEKIVMLEKALRVDYPYTIVIEDLSGISKILSDKAVVEEILVEDNGSIR